MCAVSRCSQILLNSPAKHIPGFECRATTVKHISRVAAMDRTESTVRKMFTAIEARLYDIGIDGH
jgi:hypothetical protein